jgi:hypothetical protein
MVGEERGPPGQGPIEEDLPGSVGEMVFSSDDVSDVHRVIIHDAGKIVSRHPIGSDDDKITDPGRIEIHFSVDQVLKQDRPFSDVEPQDGAKAGCFHVGNLVFREGAAPPVVPRHLSFGELFLPKAFQSLFGAKTFIALSFSAQSVGQFTINGYPLGLTIRADGSVSVGTFVPGNSEPLKIL